MKRSIMIVVALVSVLLMGCASSGKPYDEQFVTQYNAKGKPSAWVINVFRTKMTDENNRPTQVHSWPANK